MTQKKKSNASSRKEASGRKTPTETKTSRDGDPSERPPSHPRDWEISKGDAAAGSPTDESVCGEEDPGAGLEYLVRAEPDEKPKGGSR